jgi:predicted nuclease with TOPRIM domain
MSILTLGQGFESTLFYIQIKEYINKIKGQLISENDNFKDLLIETERKFREDTQIFTDIKKMSVEDLKVLNQSIKKFNDHLDKLNNLYYDENYFGDGELKQLFFSISRQAHQVENISRKYLFTDHATTQTPDYIKEGLANFSRQTISNKLRSDN